MRRRILKAYCIRTADGLSVEEYLGATMLGRILVGAVVESDSEGWPCQKDSEGFCVVKNLRGCGVQEDSEVVSC